MSDFGANIFDDAPVQGRRAERKEPLGEAGPAARSQSSALPVAPRPEQRDDRREPPAQPDRRERRDVERDDRRGDRHGERRAEPHDDRRERADHRRGGRGHDLPDAPGPRAERRDDPREPRTPQEPRRDDRERHGERPRPQADRQPRREAAPTESPAPITPTKRRSDSVHVVVDLAALEADARSQGGEVLYKRLLMALGNGREVGSALCFAKAEARVPAGFEVQPTGSDLESGLRFAAAALTASAHGIVVLAPASPAIAQLASSLVARGSAVEVVGFTLAGGAPGGRKLGRDSLFIP